MSEVENESCPCAWGTPCHPRCTCVNGASSRGCARCCRYGSDAQRRAMAAQIIGREAEAARLRADVARLEGERDRRPVAGFTVDGVEVRVGDPVWFLPQRERQAPRRWFATSSGGAEYESGWSQSLDDFASTAEAAIAEFGKRWRERFGREPELPGGAALAPPKEADGAE